VYRTFFSSLSKIFGLTLRYALVARYHLFDSSLFPVKGKVFRGTSLTVDVIFTGGGSASDARTGVNEVGAGGSTGERVSGVLDVLSEESEDSSVWLDGGTGGAGVLHAGAGGTGGLEDVVVYLIARWLRLLIRT
jgi:hypothetical protein